MTRLSLTIHADGSNDFEVVGASRMPRHWIYDYNVDLVAKSGMIDFKTWVHEKVADSSPFGESDTTAIITDLETALERELSLHIMRDGEAGAELFLLLDGVLAVEVDGEEVAEVGPGSVLGERAVLERGPRTSTLRARTPVKVAVASADDMQAEALAELASHHRREDA